MQKAVVKNQKVLSLFLCLVLAFSSLSFTLIVSNVNSAEAAATTSQQAGALNSYGNAAAIKDGVILHAWCWSFNTVKQNLANIANAGYTSVQLSPINEILQGDGGGMQLMGNGKWYYNYQATAYTIGNYQLGTRNEFVSMCAEAEKYGIKILVDVVANHTTPDQGAVAGSLKNISGGLYHNRYGDIDYNSRESVTQNNLIGLPDCNTHNSNYQQLILNYLKECVSLGADGFRYDAAKHIELPDDGSFGSSFWPTILKNGSEFQYGEILQDGGNPHTVRISEYDKLMGVTASSFGHILRRSIGIDELPANTMNNYQSEGAVHLVGWVESHDNYTGDGSWQSMDNTDVRLAWAVLAARTGNTPLFFSRPNGSSTSNQWGTNQIGAAGDDNYKHAEVTAVNKFRSAMIGQRESLENMGDNAVLKIERGNAGAVIINASSNSKSFNGSTSLPNGTYEDHAHPGKYYTVSNGTISGTISGRSIIVLYDASDLPDIPTTIPVPTTTAAPTTAPDYSNLPDLTGKTVVFFDNSQKNWSDVYLYYYKYEGDQVQEYRNWPGEKMTYVNADLYYSVIDTNWSQAYVLLNNDKGDQIPSEKMEGFVINKGEQKLFTDGGFVDFEIPKNPTTTVAKTVPISTIPKTTPPPTTVPIITTTMPPVTEPYYPNLPDFTGKTIVFFDNSQTNWDEVYLYYYNPGGGKEPWPGKKMTYVGDDLYYYEIETNWTPVNVLVNNNKNGENAEQIPVKGEDGYVLNRLEQKLITANGFVDFKVPVRTVPPKTVPPVTASEINQPSPTLLGDANLDGEVSVDDATDIQKHLASLITLADEQKLNADANGDGFVTIDDVTAIQKHLAMIDPLF
ncbi:MAG: starch-binding protein [Oscillospiraceae bacterium]|nr:starch-binding protein [Oscillospiraceae bacterium]